jgi:eukaryotic-like serine/threonine-protein kinase
MDPAQPPQPVLMDRYALGELLGRGGMGEVYVGHDRVLDRRVAIKLLPGGAGSASPDPELTRRLRGEARAAAVIEHPNVVRVHDLTITDTTIFVVMEFLEGESLRGRLRRQHRLAAEEAVRIAADVCLALAAAHQAGVIHRDIGPGNIMLCADGTVRVMDFGLARIAGAGVDTTPGHRMGTPAYVSPEQVAGETVDARADLYSLGCTLYHMVTGQPPFTGASVVDVAWQHRHATPRPPGTLATGLPVTLEGVIQKAMAKSPGERFSDALQMRTELVAVLEQGSSHNDSPTPHTPAPIPTVAATDETQPTALPEAAGISPSPVSPVHTYRPTRNIDMAVLDAIDLEGAPADRRRMRLGLTLILVALAILLVVSAVMLRP